MLNIREPGKPVLRIIKIIIFDMDGTIFISHLDWQAIKKELNIKTGHILKEIYQTKNIDQEKIKILEKYEKKNTLRARPIKGVKNFLTIIGQKDIKTALITNNNQANTNYLLNKYDLQFDYILTREIGLWKPDPEPLNHVLSHFGIRPDEAISIGDSLYDVTSSHLSGIEKIYIINKKTKNDSQIQLQPEILHKVTFFDDYFDLGKKLTDVDMSTMVKL